MNITFHLIIASPSGNNFSTKLIYLIVINFDYSI